MVSRASPRASERSSSAFAPIARRSLADGVRRQLEQHIRGGTLPPGSMLPTEEALGHELGVSRSSVREALRDVVAIGLVERRGTRAYVVEQLPEVRLAIDVRRDRIREVFETRRLIEVQLTEYAAARATPRQRAELADLAARIEAATDLEALRPLDRAFHGAITAAAGNALLAELHTKVLDAVFTAAPFDELLHGEPDPADAHRVLLASAGAHAAIARAVIAGDVATAGAAARAHLDDVERRLTR